MGMFLTSLTRDDVDIPVVVNFDAVPECKGSRDKYGVPMEPDEPAHIDIYRVTDGLDEEVTLTSEERDSIEEQISIHLHEASMP